MAITPDSVLLTDRLVLVTGAAQGIGAAVATACARFGADVAICDRDGDGLARTADEISGLGRRVFSELLDVRDGDAVQAWVGTLPDSIHVLVNNAGGGFHAELLDVNDKGQDSLIRENFTSVTNFVRGVRTEASRRRFGFDHQHHVDRSASRGTGVRDLQRDESCGRQPDEVARARARRRDASASTALPPT